MRPPYGANCLVTIGGVSYAVMETSDSSGGAWVEVLNGPVGLRCWWADPLTCRDDIDAKSFANRVYIVLPEIKAWLTCVFGMADQLIPLEDREATRVALSKVDPACQHLRFVEYAGADHGFMCEARSSFNPQASAQGWRLLLGDDLVV